MADQIQELLKRLLPGVGPLYVANAKRMEDRDVLLALWKAHRTKFVQDNNLERAVGAAALVELLERRRKPVLIAAHVVTDENDYPAADLGSAEDDSCGRATP